MPKKEGRWEAVWRKIKRKIQWDGSESKRNSRKRFVWDTLSKSCNLLDHLSIVEDTLDVLRKGLVVTDVVYNPPKSKLLQQAKEAKATVINGLGMMLWQGTLGFKLFTGEEMPFEDIRKIMFE